MAITYTWNIERLDCFPQAEGQTDVVFTAFWQLTATDGTNTSSAFGSQAITYKAGETFTPYASLTKDQVVGWVQAAMVPGRIQELETNLAVAIGDIVNPPVVTPALPWA
jgi:hypothetical protein